MRKVKKIKIKPIFATILKIVGILLFIVLGIFLFYKNQISQITKYGYSYEAAKNILFSKNKNYVLSVGENKTLNCAFESTDLVDKYLDNYSKIKYVSHKHLISNINKALDLGYSNSDINIIFSHGDDEDAINFLKKERIKYLEEFFSFPYAKLKNYDRYVAYSDLTGESEEDVVIMVNLNLDKDDYTDYVEVNDYSIDMLVNKHRCLNKDFSPDSLVEIDRKYASESGMQISKNVYDAYIEMYNAALSDGMNLIINSAYRSYSDQEQLVNTYINLYGQDYVDKYVAKPGYSEHQTALALDVGSTKSNIFANSKEYLWMQDNAYKYGFIYRYDKRYENITGFRNEAWHYRYVGKDIAKYVYEHNNMSLEEYYVIFLDN